MNLSDLNEGYPKHDSEQHLKGFRFTPCVMLAIL